MEDREFFDPLGDESPFEWQPVPGYPEGGYEMVLAEADDGSKTRLLRVEPGLETDEVLTHDFYEEVFILEGGFIDKRLDEVFTAGMYAYRTPGMEHGPYEMPLGCLAFEVRYYR